ncbi:MAG: OmpA family protein [Desulfobulbaceae bacterium]|jgi:peptidoglycan-associated lipoprotein|nr:OmpA family protein [Desulfobulbaceae bacterium]
MKGQIVKTLCVSGMVASLALFTSGCAKDNVPSDPAEGSGATTVSPTVTDAPDIGATAGSVEPIDSDGGTATNDNFKIVEGRTHEGMLPVYFDFDRFVIRDDQKSRIEGNAEFLKANTTYKITIEGNTDERGTKEYNIALGEQRALVAKKYMMNLGVSSDRIFTRTYGEENPLLFGHDEYSWSQNRRDDFIIQ